MASTANYVVYRDTPTSGAYHAQRSDGIEIAVNQDHADPVIQAALDAPFLRDPQSGPGPGDIYVQSGYYDLTSPQFEGFTVHSYTRMTLDPTAELRVPSGYTGALFQFLSNDSVGVEHTMIDGGLLTELVPVHRQWTGFLLQASATTNSSGIFFNKIANTIIFNAKVGIKLVVDGKLGFINDNTFQFLRMWDQEVFVEFDQISDYQVGQETSGILFNHFFDLRCEIQPTGTTKFGVKDIAGVHNTFLETQVIDIDKGAPDAKLARISNLASNTLIIGGILAGEPAVFVDQGVATKILDS